MTTKNELAELNQKFDTLISILTKQAQPEIKASIAPEPVKKKRGRPKKVVVAPVVVPVPAVERVVTLYVTPVMRIADQEYGGTVKVKEGIAAQLMYMMQKHRQYEQKTQQFIDHGTRDHGVIS